GQGPRRGDRPDRDAPRHLRYRRRRSGCATFHGGTVVSSASAAIRRSTTGRATRAFGGGTETLSTHRPPAFAGWGSPRRSLRAWGPLPPGSLGGFGANFSALCYITRADRSSTSKFVPVRYAFGDGRKRRGASRSVRGQSDAGGAQARERAGDRHQPGRGDRTRRTGVTKGCRGFHRAACGAKAGGGARGPVATAGAASADARASGAGS